MGKGNRSRIERAMTDTNNGSYEVKAKKNKVSGAGIFVTISAILVVIALLMGCISMINQGGWFARSQTVVKTENYKVTGTMMNYFFMSQFNNYYSMYQSYLGSNATREQILSIMGIDASKSFKDQYMKSGAEGAEQVTVFDFYMGLTEEYVTRLLTYCEYAPNLNIELTPEDLEEIDHSIEHMKESYKSTKDLYEQFGMSFYKNFSAYLAASYGEGINENDLRECMKLTTLAGKVEERLSDDFKIALRGEKDYASIEQYVKDNPASFLMADYYSYSFSVSNKGMTDADFEAEKAEILEKAKALAGVEGKDAYKAAVLELLKEAELKTYRDKNWSTILKENDNDEEKAEAALLKQFEEKAWTEAIQDQKFNNTLKEKYKYPATHTDLSKWVFGFDAGECTEDCKHEEGEHEKDQDPAKKGDITYIESTSEREETVKKETTGTTSAETTGTAEETTTDAAAPAAETTAESTKETETSAGTGTTSTEKVKVTTYTVTVYLLEKEAYRDETQTEKFGYALFTSKEDAEKFYEAMVAKKTNNLDTLIEVLNDLHEEITVNTYNAQENYVVDTLKDQQKIDTMDEWLKKAKEGDLSPVTEVTKTTVSTDEDGKSKETKTTYYAVMVYEGKGDLAWFYNALVGATSVEIEDWYEENGLELTYNDKAYKYINI